MNYIGSKFKLSSWLLNQISHTVNGNLQDKTFCDIFAGTGIVGRTFKNKVKKVISNDIEHYSYILNKNYIENKIKIPNSESLLSELNSLPLRKNGFIFKNYCIGSGSNRQYFTDHNGKKIDTIRIKIEEWKSSKKINKKTYYFLLASLLESADKVANTASVYGAFLKHIKKSAQKNLILEPADFIESKNSHKVFNEDSNTLIRKISGDILYLDPPYNHRQYGANYHLLNTISLYDNFTPQGKTGLREYTRSKYCIKKDISNSFEELIKYAKFKYIFLSYNNEGLMNEKTTKDIMKKYGKYKLVKKKYQRFKADKTENRKHKADNTFEYLHILVK